MKKLFSIVAILSLVLSPITSAFAADQTWNGGSAANGNWGTTANWVGGAAPGSTTLTTNTDTATFNAAIANTWGNAAGNPVVINSATQNIGSITFDLASGNYFVGSTSGNSLLLTNAGTIQIAGTLTATNLVATINAPIVLEGAGGTYTFTNNSANGAGAGAGTLNFGGGITGGAAGATVLTLNGSNTNSNTISGVIGNGSATSVAIVKSGAGTWVLSGANTYTGATTISAGVLNIQNSSALGTIAAGTSVADGAALQIQGNIAVGAETLTLNGTGIGATGALRNISGNNSWAGAITLGSATRINSDSGTLTLGAGGITGAFGLTVGGVGNTTITGVIGTGAGTLTKDGIGTLTLSGANTYTGTTTISAGTLTVTANDALGTNAAGTTVANGAMLNISGGINYSTTEALTLNGAGVGNVGAFHNVSGDNTFAGAITLASASTIGSTAGTLTASGNIDNGGFLLTVTGAGNETLSGIISGLGGLTKSGTGTLTLSGVNTYTGVTTISGGTLSVATIGNGGVAGNLGQATNAIGNIVLDGGTLSYTGLTDSTDRGITVNATGGTINVTTAGQTLTLDTTGIAIAALGTLTVGGAGDTTVSSIVSGAGGLTKSGAGTLTLSGVNTYTGVTTISGGTLSVATIGNGGVAGNLGQATNAIGNIVLDGGTLSYTGLTDSTDRGITVNATGGTIDVTTAGQTLTLDTTGISIANGGILTAGGAGDIEVTSVISGAGGLTKSGAGTLTLSGANTYTGDTLISAGTILLANVDALSSSASVTVNVNDGITFDPAVNIVTLKNLGGTGNLILEDTAASAVALTANNAGDTTLSGIISGSGSLTKTGAGTLTLSGVNTYSGVTNINGGVVKINAASGLGDASATNTISFNGGTLESTAGLTLVANRAITLNGAGTLQSDAGTLTVDGTITNGANLLTVTGAGNTTINGVIGGGAGGLTKTGAGTLTLSVANTYTGATTVGAGILNIQNGGSLGGVGTGTSVADGAALQMDGVMAVGAEALTLNGTGVANGGALRNINGNSSWAGDITLGSASRINTDVGATTTLSGGISGAGQTLTVGGAGNTRVQGVIGTGTGGLTKDGAGKLTLLGANTYTGATTVSAGTLELGAAGVIADTSAVSVSGGATLDLFGHDETVGSLAGTGTVTSGAVGAITLTAGGDNTSTSFSGLVQDGAGTMAFTKTGTGTLTLSGVQTYTGLTTIGAGTLALGGNTTLAGDLTQAGTGSLTLGANTLTLGGTGVYTMGAGQTLNLSITNAVTFGNIAAAGDAAVTGGTIHISSIGAGITAGDTFLVFNGGAAGSFAGLTYTDTSYTLGFTGAAAAGDLTLTAVRENTFSSVSADGNTEAVAAVFDEIAASGTATGDMATVLSALDSMTSAQEISDSLETMHPDVSSGAMQGARTMNSHFLTAISNRLAYARSGFANAGSGIATGDLFHGTGFWMQGLGSHAKQGERGGIEGYTTNTFGTTIGIDKLLNDHVRMGLAGGYGFGAINSKTPGSPSADINSWQATVYGSYDSVNLSQARANRKYSRTAVRNQCERLWYVDGMLSFTQNGYDSRREIFLGTDKRVAKADNNAQQYSTKFETGYTLIFDQTRDLEMTPFVSLGYNYLYMNKYKENGADALNLNVDGQGYHQLEQGLGLKLAYPFIAESGTFVPAIKGAWLFDYLADKFETTASFAGGGPSFNSYGVKPARNAFLLGAELAFLNKGNMTLTGNFDWLIRDQYQSYTYYLTARFDF